MQPEPQQRANPFLSKRQIRDYTRASTRAKQLRVLRSNGIRHTVDGDGWPVVTWAAVEGERETQRAASGGWKPNKVA